MKVFFKTPAGIPKEVKIGFSWTTLFFGFFPALLRGDFKWAIIMFLAACVTVGFSWVVFPFIYNKLYIKEIIEKGWKPADANSAAVLKMKGFYIPEV